MIRLTASIALAGGALTGVLLAPSAQAAPGETCRVVKSGHPVVTTTTCYDTNGVATSQMQEWDNDYGPNITYRLCTAIAPCEEPGEYY